MQRDFKTSLPNNNGGTIETRGNVLLCGCLQLGEGGTKYV